MANIRRITSLQEIPKGSRYVVVTRGKESGMTRDGDNFIVTADHSLPPHEFESHLQVAISDAELVADRERIDTVYVCADAPRAA